MLSILKAFTALVVAALGTTAFMTHGTKPVRLVTPVHVEAATVQTAADREAEWVLLHPVKPLYVPPPPAPDPQAESAAPDAAAPAGSPTWSAAPPPQAQAPARPPITIGSGQQALINADRAAAGLPPLTWSGCLAGIAAGQSAAMAARGQIYHGNGVNQAFGCGLGSTHSGENVGYWSGGINDAQLNTMFMNSPGHRANIMGSFTYVGTAWVVAPNGAAYLSVEFA